MWLKEIATVEFKSIVNDDIKKSVIAFANSAGGTLYAGIAGNGDVVGRANADEDIMSINNMLRDGITRDVTLFAQSKIEQMDDKDIIRIEVQRGTDRPYYLARKRKHPHQDFFRPSGIHISRWFGWRVRD